MPADPASSARDPEFITQAEAARILGWSSGRICQAVRRGRLASTTHLAALGVAGIVQQLRQLGVPRSDGA